MTYAKVVADSISPSGDRLTTFEVRFHRFVLAEFNTHRVFSRNSASSRAIPLAKQLARATGSPAMPVAWPVEQKGMQGGDEVEDVAGAEGVWQQAALQACLSASDLGARGVHKSVVNRLLEPFLMHIVVVTATAWGNFFRQRCSPLAQPEIRVAAEAMREAYEASRPLPLADGQWHLPYIDQETWTEVVRRHLDEAPQAYYADLVRISAARCARVSYLTQDGSREPDADVALYDRLVTADPMHASPLEHVATPEASNEHWVNIAPPHAPPVMVHLPRYGNLLGWRQHRFDVEAAHSYGSYS